MGTRGWLVFVYKGNYYVFWNNNDSYQSCMGMGIVKQLFELMLKFDGNIQEACDHWGNLLTKLEWRVNCASDGHPFNEVHSFTDIEGNLKNSSTFVVLEQPVGSLTAEIDCVFVEYIWEINLDNAQLFMTCPYYSVEATMNWHFKHIYFLMKQPKLSQTIQELWLEEAESYSCEQNTIQWTCYFKLLASVLMIQAQFRRYLAFKKSLEPGSGMMFLKAKKEFEALQKH